MTLSAVLAVVVGILGRAEVPYMVTGSLASTFHGEPRATRDLDIVIDPDNVSLARLVADLQQQNYYVDSDAALTALQERGQFNAIGPDGWKVDFMIRRDRPFSIEEFGRRQQADLLGQAGYVATAEDMILAKLEWAAATESERQLRDVAGMLAVAGDVLDLDYLERWVERLGLRAQWLLARNETSTDRPAGEVP
jgi:hypothetical protein